MTSIMALVPRSKRPRMAMSPRSRLLIAGVAGVVVATGRSVVGAGVSWWMCCPVGMVEAGVVERVGSRVMAEDGKSSWVMAPSSSRISLCR